jgi:peptidoglycan/LPS O-acetylase OafA/YrhL
MPRSIPSPVQAPQNGSLYSSKIEGLQVLRAVAVLLVTWLHSTQLSDSFFSRPFDSVGTFRVANLGMFGVDIFFAISGFILTMVTLRPSGARPFRQAYTFIMRRLIRIYPIYWILLLLPIGRLLHQHRLHVGELVRSLLLLPGLSVPIATPLISSAWTLTFEMFFYATMTVLILFNPLKAAQKTVWTLLGFVLLGVVFGIHRPVLVLVSNPILVEFVAGALLARADPAGLGTIAGGLGLYSVRNLGFPRQQLAPDQHHLWHTRVAAVGNVGRRGLAAGRRNRLPEHRTTGETGFCGGWPALARRYFSG